MSGNAKLLKKIDKINPETDIGEHARDGGSGTDDDEDHAPTAAFQRSSTKMFLGHLEATTGLDFDGDGKVAGGSGGGSRQPSVGGSRPPSAIQKSFSRAGSVSGSDGIRSGKASPANVSSKVSSGRTSSPQSQQIGGSGNMFSNLASVGTDQLKKLQKPVERGAEVVHLDEEKNVEDLHHDSDEDNEAAAGGPTLQSRKDKTETIPIFSGPSAAETLVAAESEDFNRHDPGRMQMNLQRMRDAAKAKVATTAKIGNMLDKNKELKLSNEILDMAISQLGSDDWRTRKVAAYDVMDEVIVRTQKAREDGDTESMKIYFEKVEKHIIPLFCDTNWWVRKAAIHGVVKLSKDDPSAIQDAVVGAIATGDNYKGRWTAARSAVRMYDAAYAADKAEESMKTKIRFAVLELLADDHWIVRQEAVNALSRFANFRDVHVVSKALSILPHPEAKVRQVAVTVLNSFMDTDGKHDAMSNKQVAEKMMESGLTEQESFEALDDNGNGRLSAKELRAGLKDMINIIFSVSRIKTFLGEAANKDMRFGEFLDIVKKRIEEPPRQKAPLQDFYDGKKGLEKEVKDARKKWFRENGVKMMTDIVNEILNKLPVDYNLVPWVTKRMEVALRAERDWICKDRLLEGYFKMVAFHDPYLPFMLCELLLDKHNSGKLCNQVATLILEVADVMGDDYMTRGEIGIFKHEWIDLSESPKPSADRDQDRIEGTEEHLDAKANHAKIGSTRIEVVRWDICEVMVDKLYNPSVDMQLAAARCLVRFWDKGSATAAMQVEAEELLKTAQKKENFLNIAKEEFKKDLEKGEQSNVRAGVNPALVRKKSRAISKVATPRDDEYPPEIQSKIAALKELYRKHEEQMERVEKRAKLDKMVLDGLKNARKSDNDELSQLAHQAVDIIMANSKSAKATKTLRNAVNMVKALHAGGL